MAAKRALLLWRFRRRSANPLIITGIVLLSSHDFFVNQTLLTGEACSIEKHSTG